MLRHNAQAKLTYPSSVFPLRASDFVRYDRLMLATLFDHLRESAELSRLSEAAFERLDLSAARRKPVVLLVDDDPDVAPLVELALDRYGCCVKGVLDGASALEQLRLTTYDLVILDLGMDEMGGLDVLRAMKREPSWTNIPVLVLTSDNSEAALARSFGYGADDFVSKPFKDSELAMRAYRLVQPLRNAAQPAGTRGA